MGSSSRSTKTTKRLTTTCWQYLTQLRSWCGRHRYLAITAIVSPVLLMVLTIGLPSGSSVTESLGSDDEEFADLGLEEETVGDVRRQSLPSPQPLVKSVTPASSAEFTDLTLNFGGERLPATGVVAATFEGQPRPSASSPVWLAGTIETDDSPVAPFPSTATGPILLPQ